MWPPLKKLNMASNDLRYLPMLLVGRWDKLEELRLTGNQWNCDCDNQYLVSSDNRAMCDQSRKRINEYRCFERNVFAIYDYNYMIK